MFTYDMVPSNPIFLRFGLLEVGHTFLFSARTSNTYTGCSIKTSSSSDGDDDGDDGNYLDDDVDEDDDKHLGAGV